jgi:L-2-hydroxyglutarate oxidase LhgO
LDAIVVGAGVAGSALAYTLGKVILSSSLAPFLLYNLTGTI